MEFKRSSLLSANLVVGYFSFNRKGTTKKVKLGTKQVTRVAHHWLPQPLLISQNIKCVQPMTFSQKLAKFSQADSTQDLQSEQVSPDADSLAKVKQFLDKIFLLNVKS